ncbi:MAG TPA: hypothetical protein VF533_16225, partial [Solirubrobacteraceae bacterium]
AAACGNARTPVPDVRAPQAPRGERSVDLPAAGVHFAAPANWNGIRPEGPLVGGIESRRATLAVWRYPRTEPLPRTRAELRRVRDLLIERVRLRDPTFELAHSRLARRAQAPAVELTGAQAILGRRVRVRSAHVFRDGVEVVVDAYAPPRDFDRLDRAVFLPALRSLRVGPAGS